MKKRDIETIKKTLLILEGRPLRNFGRAGSLITADFGELVECDVACYDEKGKFALDNNGKLILKKGERGRYAFQIECSARFTCGDEILLAKSDITLPNTKLSETQKIIIDGMEFFDWDNFDWSVRGDNYFDEMVSKYIGEEPFGFIVKKVSVSKFGDLAINFENGFALEIFADGSTGSENWVFYEVDNEKSSLLVMGDGIEKTDGLDSD